MDEQVMRARCPSCKCIDSACLDGYRLAFTRRSVVSGTGVADVVPEPAGTVWGVLYELDDEDVDALDLKEGHGWAYTRGRKRVRLAADDSKRDAIVYTVLAKEDLEVPPSQEYLVGLVAAAERHALPSDYIAMLKHFRAQSGT